VRFVFVDRVIMLDPGRSIETLKNVAATEDVFDDHFPGYPILPGALIVETFEQASQLLIATTHDYTHVGRLRAVRRAAFRRFVRPGDQLRVRCTRTGPDGASWTVAAAAEVGAQRVATATLEFAVVPASGSDAQHAARLRESLRVLQEAPIEAPGPGWSA
jgi:3-hydroxyacyl-[acyl-carrier-protein] dehydratase